MDDDDFFSEPPPKPVVKELSYRARFWIIMLAVVVSWLAVYGLAELVW